MFSKLHLAPNGKVIVFKGFGGFEKKMSMRILRYLPQFTFALRVVSFMHRPFCPQGSCSWFLLHRSACRSM